jgi:hypothetical protein
VGEADFRLAVFPRDLKNDLCAVPFGLVLGKIQIGIEGKPNDFLVGNDFDQFLLGIMNVLVTIRELVTELSRQTTIRGHC